MSENVSVNNVSISYCNSQDSKSDWFLASSVVTMVIGVFIVLLFRAYNKILVYMTPVRMLKDCDSQSSNSFVNRSYCLADINTATEVDKLKGFRVTGCNGMILRFETHFKDWAKDLLSGQSTSGRVIMVLIFFLSIGSVILYMIDTSWVSKNKVAKCETLSVGIVHQIDVNFNLIYMIHFFLRLIAANDKLMFLFEIHSLVDIFTIPPSLISICLSRNWIGLRFLRAVRLISLPNLLQSLNVVRAKSTIRLLQVVILFSTLVITTAGAIHMVENSGDPPDYSNAQNLSYFDAVYFMVITFTTVGFGDITCKTYIGKAFMILFILGNIAMFANSLPEIAEIINLSNRYHGIYNKRKPHILLCGHITYETVSNFLSDFLHKDRDGYNIEIIILDNHEPSLALGMLLKRYVIQVKFFKGSVMNTKDMDRIHLKETECCFVLANKYSGNPDSEDAANILRVISIKNYYANIKVIIQLIQYHNKAYLLNIPNWKMQRGDDVICLAELKLGFIAASSLAPGFSTLMVNLFTMRSYKMDTNIPRWRNEYLEGAAMELYGEYLSNDFMGLSFLEAAILSYNKLNLVLIAIQVDLAVVIYPSEPDFVITALGTKGYFIAQSSNEAKRAFYFCSKCHRGVMHISEIGSCSCNLAAETRKKIIYHHLRRKSTGVQQNPQRRLAINYFDNVYKSHRCVSLPPPVTEMSETNLRVKLSSTSTVQIVKQGSHLFCIGNNINDVFDKSRAFHWVHDVSIEDATLAPETTEINLDIFNDHIIICVFAESTGPLIGLRNFVFPLRSSHISYAKLKPIILLGNVGYLQREWKSLMNFPKLFLYIGSPLNRTILRALKIDRCSLCVILSSKSSANMDDHSLVDKEAILSTLNIKAMTFECDNDEDIGENQIRFGNEVRLITELAIDSNVQFLDHSDQGDPNIEIFMTHSFACGNVFTVSVLDSLMSTAYFNEDALGLIRILLSGCVTLEFGQLLTEGTGLENQAYTAPSYDNPYHIKLISINQKPLSNIIYERHKVYGELFTNALRFLGLICIGVYRRIDIYDPFSESELHNCRNCNRYVITNPSCNMALFDSDLIYCLSGDFNKLNNANE